MSYTVKTGFENMDVQWVIKALQSTYWADDRSDETIEKSMKNSWCFGVFEGDRQIGFCRVITDYATTFYLCDVIVEENLRKSGAGSAMMEAVISNPQLADLRGILGTKDAHGFYEKFGFEKNDKLFMQRWTKVFGQ
ncbi:MAG: GNAT family N-acetyltransferase [Oscillospiraceae bacterium]|nr:GNAT family N-acetyltransferase [Oscillospiraceae bacterium]